MRLLNFVELLPLQQLFLVTIACGFVVGAAVLIAVRLAVRLMGIDPSRQLQIRDAVIGSLSAMFALMVAFSAAGIWSEATQASTAVQREANTLENIVALSSNFPDDLREEVHAAVLRYARRAVESDWPAMSRRADVNETFFDRSNSPLVALTTRISQEAGKRALPLSDPLIAQIAELRGARLQREMLARGGVSPAQWLAMIVIAMGAMTTIAIAHNHAFGLQLVTLSIYVLGVSAAFSVILAHDRPFVGHLGVRPIPIEQAIERIERVFTTHASNQGRN
jgi:hypothetical protein